MRILAYTVPEDWDGVPVSVFARRYLELSSKSLSDLKYEGGLVLDGIPCHANAILKTGSHLALHIPEETAAYPEEAGPVEVTGLPSIIYEDEDYLILDKPPGMPVHPSPGHDNDSAVNAVAGYYQRTGQRCRIRPLYRLDKDTSGVLVLAKHRLAAGATAEKEYLAVCQGVLTGAGRVDVPIRLRDGSKIQRACAEGPDAQPAVTNWRALGTDGFHTLLSLRLETGRTHQIRVHMAHIGHPLAGDDLYGGGLALLPRQALHCVRLELRCKALGMEQGFAAPVPEDIRQAFPWINDIFVHN